MAHPREDMHEERKAFYAEPPSERRLIFCHGIRASAIVVNGMWTCTRCKEPLWENTDPEAA